VGTSFPDRGVPDPPLGYLPPIARLGDIVFFGGVFFDIIYFSLLLIVSLVGVPCRDALDFEGGCFFLFPFNVAF